jgi:hypothetical protein
MVSPAVRKKLFVAILLLGIFAAGAVLVQVAAQYLTSPSPGQGTGDAFGPEEKSVFSRADFLYGPQSWRPYQSRLDIGTVVDPNRMYVLMFVPLNGTPFGGNPALHQRGSVKVYYTFENLTGEAAFHVYGFRQLDGLWVTNRQEEFGTSGYYVIGGDTPVGPLPAAASHPVPDNYTIQLSSALPAGIEGIDASSFTFHFTQRPGSGLDSLHITTDLARKKGEVITTPFQEGTFYVTHTGGNPIRVLLLMVAVSPGQPDDFRVRLASEFIGETS